MVNGYESFIIPALIGALIGALSSICANIFFYEYRFKNEFLEKQIFELLCPLYIQFKETENKQENIIDGIERDSVVVEFYKEGKIKEIIKNKLPLASPKIRDLLLGFLNIQSVANEIDEKPDNEPIFENYEPLRVAIFEEYEQKVKEYQTFWWNLLQLHKKR